MRYALPGSLLVHTAVLGAGLLVFGLPEPEDAPAMGSVSVEIIGLASVSSNQTATVQSDASQDLLSAGSTALSPVVPETLMPVTPEIAQPAASVQTALAPETVTPAPAEPVASVEASEALPTPRDTLAPLASSSETAVLATTTASPVMAQSVKPVGQETIAPSSVTDARTAPVPQTLTIARPSTPTSFEPPPRRQQTAEPRPQPPQPSGNGGNNAADQTASRASTGAQASQGSGGDADVARYPSQVQTKLRRALRYPRSAGGAAGEVHVQFVVSSGGQPSGLRIVQSSGNAAIDQAGLETVSRAAPFPPIPPAANRGSWTFTIPLAFTR